MAREIRNVAVVAGITRLAYLAVSAAIPLPAQLAGIVPGEPSAAEVHLMALRETAFATVLEELLACECEEVTPEELAALEHGEIPPDPYRGA